MRSPTQRRSSSAGFTLIELMVAIAIAAVLATIAVSSYTNQVRKTRRTEARNALLDLAAREERFFSTNNAYTTAFGGLGYAAAFPQPVGSGYYTVSVCVAPGPGPACAGNAVTGNIFVLTATAVGVQAKDTACASFTVDNTGLQNGTNANCWN
jgi:type IV pilus assembly protein PilE